MSIDLFQPFTIGGLELRNRFVRSATWDGTADDSGAVTDDSVALYRALGHGGVGLIVSGFAFVSRSGRAMPGQYGAHTDGMIPGLARLAQAAHEGGARIALQIHHAGVRSDGARHNGTPAPAVSLMSDIAAPHRMMTDEEIESLLDDFASAARRARLAGFDAVQLHGAHGYLLSQFLSPLFNFRTDRWGGSIENRGRFHLEATRRVRRAVGNDFTVMIKFGIQDEKEGGLTLDDGLATARLMAEAGIEAIEVSAGAGASPRIRRGTDPEQAYYRPRAAALKRVVTVPVAAVGGIRSLELATDIVKSGDADLISMARPFIREPGIILRWREDSKGPSACITCSRCLGLARKGRRVACWEERRLQREATVSEGAG